MEALFKHLNILAIPTDFCNMRCVYCFHNEFYETPSINCMNDDTLKNMFKTTIPFYERVAFIWHGGEPLSVGIDFYKKVVEYQKEFNTTGTKITNSIQTNLSLMTDELAEFLVANGFDFGSSFDGVDNSKTRGNTEKILAGKKTLLNHNKKCGMIQVVSKINVSHLVESYELMKDMKTGYSLNPYIAVSQNDGLKLDSSEYAKRIIEFYDYWKKDKECCIEVNYFIRILEYILLNKKSICSTTSCLGKWISVRPNGDVYPCNRYFPKEYCYGNVNDVASITDVFESAGFYSLVEKAVARREKCKDCEIFDFCEGGCNNNFLNEKGIENNGGFVCESLPVIFNYIKEDVEHLKSLGEDLPEMNPYLVRMLKKAV